MIIIIISSGICHPAPTRPDWLALPTRKCGLGWDYFIIKILRSCPTPTRPDWSVLPARKCRLGWDLLLLNPSLVSRANQARLVGATSPEIRVGMGLVLLLKSFACVPHQPGQTGQRYQPGNAGWDGTILLY